MARVHAIVTTGTGTHAILLHARRRRLLWFRTLFHDHEVHTLVDCPLRTGSLSSRFTKVEKVREVYIGSSQLFVLFITSPKKIQNESQMTNDCVPRCNDLTRARSHSFVGHE
jgi:hypothetical protein